MSAHEIIQLFARCFSSAWQSQPRIKSTLLMSNANTAHMLFKTTLTCLQAKCQMSRSKSDLLYWMPTITLWGPRIECRCQESSFRYAEYSKGPKRRVIFVHRSLIFNGRDHHKIPNTFHDPTSNSPKKHYAKLQGPKVELRIRDTCLTTELWTPSHIFLSLSSESPRAEGQAHIKDTY